MKKQAKKKTCCSKAACCCKPKKKKAKKGFTLIEMMVVIIIIGILSAFIIMSVIGVRQKASASRATAEMSQLKNIAEIANAEGCTQLTATSVNSGAGISIACTSGITKNYTTIQTSPAGATYTLLFDGNVKTITSTTGGAWAFSGTGCASTGCTLTLSSSPTFTFTASGFTSSATYACSASGCSCSVSGGCTTF